MTSWCGAIYYGALEKYWLEWSALSDCGLVIGFKKIRFFVHVSDMKHIAISYLWLDYCAEWFKVGLKVDRQRGVHKATWANEMCFETLILVILLLSFQGLSIFLHSLLFHPFNTYRITWIYIFFLLTLKLHVNFKNIYNRI